MQNDIIRILVVDDDEDDYFILKDLLSDIKGTRYITEWADSYESAVKYIQEGRYEVYIFDYRLGSRNGLELLKEVYSAGDKAPAILLTSQDERDIDMEAMRSGAYDFLVKGKMNASLLERSIRYAIERKRLEDEVKEYAVNLESMVDERTRQLREKDAQLVQSGKLALLGEIAAGIAHELNQPLSGINLMAQGLLIAKKCSKLNDQIFEEKMNSILEQVERIDRIITHLSTFGRQTDMLRQEVVVNKPLSDVFKLIGQQMINRNISVEMDLEEQLPAISADPNRLEQVFLNIIGNGRDSLDSLEELAESQKKKGLCPEWYEGWSKHINIKTYSTGGNVVIEISDNGIGIPKDIINKIFDPFFTTKSIGKGTGLGLSISYGIIKEYGGNIDVSSGEMKGSRFIISFPVVK